VMLKDFPSLPIVGTPVLPRDRAIGAELEQNFPNPFRGATTLRYKVTGADRVRLRVFDSRGAMVRVVVDGFRAYARTLEAGSLRPGAYFYQLEMGGRTLQRAMEVLR
jgi:hypothetical protein